MIYVTHDQTEALTFADQVVVMERRRGRADRHAGRAVRAAEAHLRRPLHRLARHERAALRGRRTAMPTVAGQPVATANAGAVATGDGRLEIGVRPEFVSFAERRARGRRRQGDAMPAAIASSRRALGEQRDQAAGRRGRRRCPQGRAHLRFDPAHTRVYATAGWWREAAMNKTVNQKAWFFVLPVVLLVAFNAIIPLMTVVNYSVQETFGDNVFFWAGHRAGSRRCCSSERFHASLGRQLLFTVTILRDRGAARRRDRARHAAQGAVGVGVPGADGAAAADPVERGRRDLEHLRAARHRPARPRAERASASTTTTRAIRSPPGSP